MKKVIYTLVSIVLFISHCYAQKNPAGNIWLHMLTTGQPADTKYLGDQLNSAGTWYINFEVGQVSWYQTDAGIGLSNTDPSAWTWRTANWYANGSGSNKQVRSDFGDFRFTQTGTWYLNGRAKGDAGDAFHYANTDVWTNTGTFGPIYYFTVIALNNPSAQSAVANSSTPSSAIDLAWSKDAQNHNVMIVRKKTSESWTEPTQGVTYTVGNSIGAGVVVYSSNGTSYTNTGLSSSTSYDYKFYSGNFSYYSAGVTSAATTGTGTSDSFRSVVTGDWNNPSAWESSADGSEWNAATLSPTSSANAVVMSHIIDITGAETANNLTINSGGILTVNSGKSVTVNGTLSNNVGISGLVIKSGGSLIENSGVSATVECAVPGNEWHLISAPVSDAMSGMFIGKYLQTHSESTNAFTDILTLTEPLTPMKGFALWGDATGFTTSYAGALNSGNTSISLNRSAVGNTNGWNLVGNPYPSSIDWDASTGWTKTNVANATYIHVNNATWAAYVGGSGTNGGSQFIAPCQGFFVYVKDDGSTSGTLGVTNAVRVNNATAFYKNTLSDLARLQVSGNGYSDEAVVRFLPEATAEFDNEFDAHKLFGDVNEAAQIYTSGSVPLAINTLPETGSVPVGIHVGAGGTYTITATEVIDMPVLALEDIQTGIFTDLLSNSYSFNFMPGDPEQRFVLHFGTVSIPETANINANIFSNGKVLNIDLRNSSKSDIFIYTVTGQLVALSSSVKGMNTFNLENSGNYIVKVITDQSSMVQKVFIK